MMALESAWYICMVQQVELISQKIKEIVNTIPSLAGKVVIGRIDPYQPDELPAANIILFRESVLNFPKEGTAIKFGAEFSVEVNLLSQQDLIQSDGFVILTDLQKSLFVDNDMYEIKSIERLQYSGHEYTFQESGANAVRLTFNLNIDYVQNLNDL